MKKIKDFNNISFFKVENLGFFIYGKAINTFLNNEFESVFIMPMLPNYQVVGCSDYYIVFTDFESTLIFSHSEEIFNSANYGYLTNHKDLFLVENYQLNTILFFDIKSKLFNSTNIQHWGQSYWSNHLFIQRKKHITSYSLINFTSFWHYELPERVYNVQRRTGYIDKPFEEVNAEILKILGVYSGALYIVLNSGRIIGLEENTGQEVFTKIEPDQLTLNYENERIYTPTILWLNTQMDSENGIIFGLLGDFYAEIDLKNSLKAYKVYDIGYQSNTKKIKCTNWGVWQGDEIFFGETNFAKEPARVGIFNRKTKQVTWTSDELGEEGVFKGLRKIDYAQNKLYILDMENTLHIFER